eukprot:49702-Rhodomonas_salina.3
MAVGIAGGDRKQKRHCRCLDLRFSRKPSCHPPISIVRVLCAMLSEVQALAYGESVRGGSRLRSSACADALRDFLQTRHQRNLLRQRNPLLRLAGALSRGHARAHDQDRAIARGRQSVGRRKTSTARR